MKTILALQIEQKRWQDKNFPNTTPEHCFLGIAEEVGELAHARLKTIQGIRGTEKELREKEVDSVADIFIFLVGYCNQRNIDLQETVESVWEKVKERDWQKDPKGESLKES